MRWAVALLALALVGCGTCALPPEPSPPPPVQVPEPPPHPGLAATVCLGVGVGGSFYPLGTAVIVHRCDRHGTVAVTCRHVVRMKPEQAQFIEGGSRVEFPITDSVESKRGDVAFVTIAGDRGAPVDLGSRMADGQEMVAVRYFKRRRPYLIGGVYRRGTGVVFSEEPVAMGDSGSGLFDAEGRLLGIVKSHSAVNPHVVQLEEAAWIEQDGTRWFGCDR